MLLCTGQPFELEDLTPNAISINIGKSRYSWLGRDSLGKDPSMLISNVHLACPVRTLAQQTQWTLVAMGTTSPENFLPSSLSPKMIHLGFFLQSDRRVRLGLYLRRQQV